MRHLSPQATCCFVRELGTCAIRLHVAMATSTDRPIVSTKADFCLARPQGVKALFRRAVSSSPLGPVGPVGQAPGGRVENNLARPAPGPRQSWFPTRRSQATVLVFTVKLCLLCRGRTSHLELSSAFRHENPLWTIPEPCQKITLANHNDLKRDCVPGSQTILSPQQLSGRKPSWVAFRERAEHCALSGTEGNSPPFLLSANRCLYLRGHSFRLWMSGFRGAGLDWHACLDSLLLHSVWGILNPDAISCRDTDSVLGHSRKGGFLGHRTTH